MKQVKLFALLIASVICCGNITAMRHAPIYPAKDTDLASALKYGNLPKIKDLIASGGIDIHNINAGPGMKGSALEIAYAESPESSKLAILEFLIAHGANASDLSHHLFALANGGEVEGVKMLCKLGVKDTDGKALQEAKEMEINSPFAHEKKTFQEIIRILEKCQ